MSPRTIANLRRELGDGFTREQVLGLGEARLRRFPDMGAVGVREAMDWANGRARDAGDRASGARGRDAFDHRYAGLPGRVVFSLRMALGEGFTPEMVLAEGSRRLTRIPGMGPVGAREALEWADGAAMKDGPPGSDVRLEALIKLARSGDDASEVLADMVRKAWTMMDAKDREAFEDAGLAAVEAARDGQPGGPRP